MSGHVHRGTDGHLIAEALVAIPVLRLISQSTSPAVEPASAGEATKDEHGRRQRKGRQLTKASRRPPRLLGTVGIDLHSRRAMVPHEHLVLGPYMYTHQK